MQVTNMQAVVDHLATLKAQIADLKEQEDAVKADLIATAMSSGEKRVSFVGTTHDVTVSLTDPAPRVDWKAVAEKCKPSVQLITANTTPGTATYTVRVFGRKSDNKEA